MCAHNTSCHSQPTALLQVEFKCILFVPGDATGLYEDYNNRKAGMKLYVRKVLIQEDFEDLLPR